ncbi:hypothetical protein EPN83_01640 [Patescibacteria group bacterium]|nr:MAG: hypothetical protein EPN83_01640 [Patescibacteria group bacterium]
MKKGLILIVVVILLLAGGVFWSRSLQKNDPGVIARGGIHWHPGLKILVKGEKVEIPENTGLGAVHSPIHTHDDLPLIHLEFDGLVRQDDIKLGQFFKVWGKDIHSFGENVKMTVNGKENSEYENYVMHDGDKIELHYE